MIRLNSGFVINQLLNKHMTISLSSKNISVIIPDVNKSLILAANSIIPISKGLSALVILISIRAQVSASLLYLDKSDIQKLESVKWNAKQIAKSPLIRSVAASLAIAQTYNLEFEKIRNMSPEEMNEHATNLVQELIDTPASPGNKILAPHAIKEHNLTSHRLGLMAQKIGNWQAKPLFDPSSIVRNLSISTLTPEALYQLIILLHEQLEIQPYDGLINSKVDNHRIISLTNIMKESIYYNSVHLDEIIEFYDPIRINSEDNKTPLERILTFTERPFPIETISIEKLPDSLLTNPLVKYASKINEDQAKEVKLSKAKFSNKQVKSITSKPKAKAKSKAKPKDEAEKIFDENQ
jgi:hypothetical protein